MVAYAALVVALVALTIATATYVAVRRYATTTSACLRAQRGRPSTSQPATPPRPDASRTHPAPPAATPATDQPRGPRQ
ncbi:hypothetical protein [Nocardioides sambongensis]|uniref:hypothetical protein n=1 Tax=Nocardioides sambongensis TaxID=2589074 RepID=UPI001125BBB4|nr:hypothetical protein [Nocardioides sambongensis]